MRVWNWIKGNVVLCIALLAVIVTAFIIPPDKEYLGYYDLRTLACLFSVMAVVCAFQNIRFFYLLASRIVRIFKNARLAVLALVWVTLVGSMLITNDTALLTFLPLSYLVLHTTGQDKLLAYTFILQNAAANLGGMLTPFGNPQNLYLYSYYSLESSEFFGIMLLPFLISVVLITLCCFFIKPTPLSIPTESEPLNVKRAILYGLLFAVALLVVIRILPYPVGLMIIVPVLLIFDRKALKKVDYALLLTFAAFFTFSGNMARMEAVQSLFSSLLEWNTLLTGALLSQVISNVPAAILLSRFTDAYAPLLQGVNVGGAGTIIASLASLITYQEFIKHQPQKSGYFMKLFTIISFAFLILLLLGTSLLQ
ncbi:MAG: citrate transporter [Clostridia bacterium]|nr:citrate transporter [Clostridia bacterium]